MKPGDRIDGFLVQRVIELPNLRSVAYEIRHEKSGARLLHLHNEDAENLFSVSFPTPPPDNTGVPHILEHSVLAGSRKYQVKDPFFEMVKSSMATFINAMTGSDYTVYPVASNVRQDFFNLAEVYWDAVFHPLLTEQTFQREGHHLELTKDGELIIKG
ncbi:MAG: insulinase family protein, partial [Tepidisphaeraceae bacterium]